MTATLLPGQCGKVSWNRFKPYSCIPLVVTVSGPHAAALAALETGLVITTDSVPGLLAAAVVTADRWAEIAQPGACEPQSSETVVW